MNGFSQGLIGQHALRLDAGANGVRDKGFNACRCPGIAPYKIAALGAQFVLGERQCCDCAWIADLPRQCATAATDTVIERGAAK